MEKRSGTLSLNNLRAQMFLTRVPCTMLSQARKNHGSLKGESYQFRPVASMRRIEALTSVEISFFSVFLLLYLVDLVAAAKTTTR